MFMKNIFLEALPKPITTPNLDQPLCPFPFLIFHLELHEADRALPHPYRFGANEHVLLFLLLPIGETHSLLA